VRILHTSDWHLGVSTGPESRIAEQRWFLDWLLQELKRQEIDALLVAGDVFDSMHPTAEAASLYFRFLARVGDAGVRDVVVVGGNHDSPSHLDAPRALLHEVNVHVVGGVPTADDRLNRMIAPLRARGSDNVAAVCLAVPYVHEYRLGIRTSDADPEKTRAAFKAAFAELYSTLADEAIERFGDLPLVATGHLTMGSKVRREDYPQEIHQVGTIEGLPVDILDPRIQYTALGHIHRCMPIQGSTAWYCGTPIPYDLPEMAVPRKVLVVDLDSESEAHVEPIEVPRRRDLLQLVGTPEAVLVELAELDWSTPLPPLVQVHIQTNMAEPGLPTRMHEALASHDKQKRPVLIKVQQRSPDIDVDAPSPVVKSLKELTPNDVFSLMCDTQKLHGDDRQQVEAAFRTVASASPETLKEMLRAIELPPTPPGDES
jgi:DNA repair protein SbcD/Mre11